MIGHNGYVLEYESFVLWSLKYTLQCDVCIDAKNAPYRRGRYSVQVLSNTRLPRNHIIRKLLLHLKQVLIEFASHADHMLEILV